MCGDLTLICVYVLDVWIVQQVAQAALTQSVCVCVCSSARVDYIDAVFGYMPAHLPTAPLSIKGKKLQPGLVCPCSPPPSPPPFMQGGGAGLPCVQSSAEFLSSAAVQGLEFSTGNNERQPLAAAGGVPGSTHTRMHTHTHTPPRRPWQRARVRPVMWHFRSRSRKADGRT